MTVEATVTGWIPGSDTFPARLALVRHSMGWNVTEAAIACRLPVSTWRGWELEGSRPQNYIEVCRAIAVGTGCNYIWLIDGTVPPGAPVGRVGLEPTAQGLLVRHFRPVLVAA